MSQDLEEFWGLIRNAPDGIPHAPDDVEGFQLDLMCRAGKVILDNAVLVQAIECLLRDHAFAGMLRPVVMIVARVLDKTMQTRRASADRRGNCTPSE